MRVKRGVAGPRRPGATSLSSHAGTEDVVGARPRKPTQFDDQRPGWDFTSGDVGKFKLTEEQVKVRRARVCRSRAAPRWPSPDVPGSRTPRTPRLARVRFLNFSAGHTTRDKKHAYFPSVSASDRRASPPRHPFSRRDAPCTRPSISRTRRLRSRAAARRKSRCGREREKRTASWTRRTLRGATPSRAICRRRRRAPRRAAEARPGLVWAPCVSRTPTT